MKTLSAIMIWACLIVLLAECQNLAVLIVSKSIAGVLIFFFAKMLQKHMSEDELNEEV